MNSKPIIFSAPMIQAILARKKSQTRRVIKNLDMIQDVRDGVPYFEDAYGDWHKTSIACPYGQPGDQLWLRETWGIHRLDNNGHKEFPNILYKADGSTRLVLSQKVWEYEQEKFQWRPSIFMPRWASRINLLIKDVRVERLQAISEADAIAEGIEIPSVLLTGSTYPNLSYEIDGPSTIVDYFHQLWDSINGKRKVLKPQSWKLWTWGKTPSDDPEAIGLDIALPGSIQWRNTDDIDLPEWVNFDLSAPPDSGYYDVIWESGDDPVHIYLSRSEPEQSDYIHPYSWTSNPWVFVIEFEVIP
jgi:hypothetical protein